jgi:glutamyl-tRNA synthetase
MLRFAPSPTGDMHIGDLRVAIFNYIVAKQRDEKFLVRIEDRDKLESIEGKDTEIMMILEKFAIKHDLVYHQSEHLNIHQNLALKLLKDKKAFICRCNLNDEVRYSGTCENLSSKDYQEIRESGQEFVIRLRKPNIDSNIDSFIIIQKDKSPTANFASACDDMLSGVNLIIREKREIEKTPKEIYIKESLDYREESRYIHIPNIESSYTIKWLFEQGFIPDAILNYLVLLGYRDVPKEIFYLSDAIEWFDLANVSKEVAKFDIEKLKFINREHLKLIDDKELSKVFGFADANIGKVAKLYLEEASTINELESKIHLIFKPKDFNIEYGEEMRTIQKLIYDAPTFEKFDELKEHITKESGLRDKKLLIPLQILLTGAESSPKLSEVYPLIKSYILEVAS